MASKLAVGGAKKTWGINGVVGVLSVALLVQFRLHQWLAQSLVSSHIKEDE